MGIRGVSHSQLRELDEQGNILRENGGQDGVVSRQISGKLSTFHVVEKTLRADVVVGLAVE